MFHETEFKIAKYHRERLGYTGEIENMFLNHIERHEYISFGFKSCLSTTKKHLLNLLYKSNHKTSFHIYINSTN